VPLTDPARPADARAVLAEYDLGDLLAAETLPAGHRDNRKVTTTAGTFVLRRAYRSADVQLQAEVSPLLTARGFRQPRVVPTAAGTLVTRSGYWLAEFLPGSMSLNPTTSQVTAAMRHIAGYHVVLGELPLSYQPDPSSMWSHAADPDFLLAELPGLLDRYGLADDDTDEALACLQQAKPALAELPRQLVHGDIGQDNVLMDGDEVISLIDFTPYRESVLFATSGALYWYHVCEVAPVSTQCLHASMRALGEWRPWQRAELELWPAGLVREALRRLAIPLELARRADAEPGAGIAAVTAPAVGPRKAPVSALARLLPDLRRQPSG
jgi:Ser/Thr protein kinase RdoA (MazF antagonist)